MHEFCSPSCSTNALHSHLFLHSNQHSHYQKKHNANSSLPSLSSSLAPPALPSASRRRPEHGGRLRTEPASLGPVRSIRAGQGCCTSRVVLWQRRPALQTQPHVSLRFASQLRFSVAVSDQRFSRSSVTPPLQTQQCRPFHLSRYVSMY